MFFQKKKPKLDPKIRFQNRQFNQKLQKARTFKRTARPIPEGNLGKALTRAGMGSKLKQAFALLVVGGIVYLIYIPNFLTLQTIKVEGMTEPDRIATEAAIRESLNEAPFYNPQRNLLFVSKRRITEAAMKIAGVDHVNTIDRGFKTKEVKISVTAKYERFLVRDREKVYDVYNDGSTKGIAGVDRNYWESIKNPGMAKIDVEAKIINPDNKLFFSPQAIEYILKIQEELKGITGSPLGYIRLPLALQVAAPSAEELKDTEENTDEQTNEDVGVDADMPEGEEEISTPTTPVPLASNTEIQLPIGVDELELMLQKGDNAQKLFKVIVDTKENPHDVVQRLNLLLSQTAPDRYNSLAYIDLRIQSRAFVCLLSAPCN